jgi:hypothetical protein
MKKWAFITKKRALWSGIVSVVWVFYLFNFVPRNINIVASRNFTHQILDYVLNIVLFFVIFYLISSLIIFLVSKAKTLKSKS